MKCSIRRAARVAVASVALCMLGAPPVASQSVFITLGTMAGPVANAQRSQPANLLIVDGDPVLIDVGDGAAEQLAKAGIPLATVHTVFLSHLHFDHTGGLFAVLGMRFQVRTPGTLTIYGPPGTRRLVDGLLAAMGPAAEAGAGLPGVRPGDPSIGVLVKEISDGASLEVSHMRVTAARNTHYSFAIGSPEAERYQSLSLRFDLADRSIVYTGDTGPSAAVERLARDADLLVSEVIDRDAALADLHRQMPGLPPPILAIIGRHFSEQHLSADQAGSIGKAAGVRKLVLTHLAIGDASPEVVRAAAARTFGGDVQIAHDLERF